MIVDVTFMSTLIIWCLEWHVVLFCVFYVCKFTFKEEKESGHSISLDLGCELAS
jgi:predicted secreted protein